LTGQSRLSNSTKAEKRKLANANRLQRGGPVVKLARALRPKDRYKLEVLKRKLYRIEAMKRAAQKESERLRKEREGTE